jgi:hypothetical protein
MRNFRAWLHEWNIWKSAPVQELLRPGAGAEAGSVTGKKDADKQFDAWLHKSEYRGLDGRTGAE